MGGGAGPWWLTELSAPSLLLWRNHPAPNFCWQEWVFVRSSGCGTVGGLLNQELRSPGCSSSWVQQLRVQQLPGSAAPGLHGAQSGLTSSRQTLQQQHMESSPPRWDSHCSQSQGTGLGTGLWVTRAPLAMAPLRSWALILLLLVFPLAPCTAEEQQRGTVPHPACQCSPEVHAGGHECPKAPKHGPGTQLGVKAMGGTRVPLKGTGLLVLSWAALGAQ